MKVKFNTSAGSIKFSIYTERKNVSLLKHLANQHLDHYTMIDTSGIWEGETEESLIIEHITNDASTARLKVKNLAREINVFNKQTCCLVTEQKLTGYFV